MRDAMAIKTITTALVALLALIAGAEAVSRDAELRKIIDARERRRMRGCREFAR